MEQLLVELDLLISGTKSQERVSFRVQAVLVEFQSLEQKHSSEILSFLENSHQYGSAEVVLLLGVESWVLGELYQKLLLDETHFAKGLIEDAFAQDVFALKVTTSLIVQVEHISGEMADGGVNGGSSEDIFVIHVLNVGKEKLGQGQGA